MGPALPRSWAHFFCASDHRPFWPVSTKDNLAHAQGPAMPDDIRSIRKISPSYVIAAGTQVVLQDSKIVATAYFGK